METRAYIAGFLAGLTFAAVVVIVAVVISEVRFTNEAEAALAEWAETERDE